MTKCLDSFFTEHSRPRTEDLMLSDKLFIKITNRIGPKGTPDNTGTGAEA